MSLTKTFTDKNTESPQDKAKNDDFFGKHLDASLKCEYFTEKDPNVLWKNLKERLDHQKEVILPVIRDKWNALHIQNFRKVGDYNSSMFRILSQLNYVG